MTLGDERVEGLARVVSPQGDIDAKTCQLAGELGVQAAFADGVVHLVVRDDDGASAFDEDVGEFDQRRGHGEGQIGRLIVRESMISIFSFTMARLGIFTAQVNRGGGRLSDR
ncbi:hypothetical protein NLX86_20260 [Streptomyces sp. A3M-1-3]|uniref:hypothetical protein n=1 Tax=Streptomyces sp. A3M-1-3 TaxID=2962044 RepID=UPI0020B77162|nr:hypothetical protein [Streptomyces sp. A3M-1-3]MCP3820345.1 hypothetical protein [Streptomyces sp. A3M-1-3]